MELSTDFMYYASKTLYYCYLNDREFPRSCGKVSMTLTFLSSITKMKDEYDIFYIRGVYKDANGEDTWCEHYEEGLVRDNCFEFEDENHCSECNGCEAMTSHSWIELKKKGEQNDSIIIDMTSIQFKEEIVDYEEELHSSSFTEKELMKYLSERCQFIIEKEDDTYQNYIPITNILPRDYIWNATISFLKKGYDNEVSFIVKELEEQFKIIIPLPIQ